MTLVSGTCCKRQNFTAQFPIMYIAHSTRMTSKVAFTPRTDQKGRINNLEL